MGFQRLGFSMETIRAFHGLYETDASAGRFIFPQTHFKGFPGAHREILYLDGSRFVPSGFFWSFHPDGDCPVGRVFIFASATDAMAAYEIKKRHFFKNSIVFAVGPSPSYPLVAALGSMFPGSGFRLCFPDDFAGRICDVKVGAFLESLEISAAMDGGCIIFTFGGKRVGMHPADVSLSRFEKISGCHLAARTAKAKGFRTYFDQVKEGAFAGGTIP